MKSIDTKRSWLLILGILVALVIAVSSIFLQGMDGPTAKAGQRPVMSVLRNVGHSLTNAVVTSVRGLRP
ncbi:MAG: hypothetical protein K1X47_04095 [Cyclobacteriaceae bacterium]|nr:hypothetical protein [Cyclobacteriaceae bacterium]